jgi:hypothetical protein
VIGTFVWASWVDSAVNIVSLLSKKKTLEVKKLIKPDNFLAYF